MRAWCAAASRHARQSALLQPLYPDCNCKRKTQRRARMWGKVLRGILQAREVYKVRLKGAAEGGPLPCPGFWMRRLFQGSFQQQCPVSQQHTTRFGGGVKRLCIACASRQPGLSLIYHDTWRWPATPGFHRNKHTAREDARHTPPDTHRSPLPHSSVHKHAVSLPAAGCRGDAQVAHPHTYIFVHMVYTTHKHLPPRCPKAPHQPVTCPALYMAHRTLCPPPATCSITSA